MKEILKKFQEKALNKMLQKSTFITKFTHSELMCILNYEDSLPQFLIFPGQEGIYIKFGLT